MMYINGGNPNVVSNEMPANINANRKWTRREEARLKDLIDQRLTYKEISTMMGRSEKGIQQKAAKVLKQSGTRKKYRLQPPAPPSVETKPSVQITPPIANSQQLSEIFGALVVIAVGVWATAAGLFLAVLQ
jgi:hypothetical protein